MSAKPNNSSKAGSRGRSNGAHAAIDRPFEAEILEKARHVAAGYRLVLEPDADVGYIGHALELPGVMGDGKTPDQCVKELREALCAVIAHMLEEGKSPPAPADELRRTAQINIRVTEEEKLQLEAAARQQGFRGVGDFVRTTTLAKVH